MANGKILKKYTKHGITFNFRVVKNLRDAHKMPTSITIKGLGSFRQPDLKDTAKRLEFWIRVSSGIQELVNEKKITIAEADKIRKQFAKIVPTKSLPLPHSITKTEIKSLEAKYPILKA